MNLKQKQVNQNTILMCDILLYIKIFFLFKKKNYKNNQAYKAEKQNFILQKEQSK